MKKLSSIIIVVILAIGIASAVEAKDQSWREAQTAGNYYAERGEIATAVGFFKEATVIAREKYGVFSKQCMFSLISQAKCHMELGSYEEAVAASGFALEILKKQKITEENVATGAVCYIILGEGQFRRGEIDRAIPELKKGLAIMNENPPYFVKNSPDYFITGCDLLAISLEKKEPGKHGKLIEQLNYIARSIEKLNE